MSGLTSDEVKSGLMLAAVAGVALLLWTTYQKASGTASSVAASLGHAASTVGGWINPTADTNLAYQRVGRDSCKKPQKRAYPYDSIGIIGESKSKGPNFRRKSSV